MVAVRRSAQGGFTLIELMIAITILALLGAVVGPYFLGNLEKGRSSATKATMRNVQSALIQYYADMSEYPESLKDLVKKPLNEALANKWVAPYLQGKDVPLDGWNIKLQYEVTQGQDHPYELYSYGPKGKGSKEGRISIWDLE